MVRLQLALLMRAGNAYLSIVKDEDILTTPVNERKGRRKLLQSIYNAGVDLAGEAQSIAHGRHESKLCRRFFKTSLAILKHTPRTFGIAYASFSCNYGIFCRDEGSVTEAIAAFEVSCSFDNGDALVELGRRSRLRTDVWQGMRPRHSTCQRASTARKGRNPPTTVRLQETPSFRGRNHHRGN